MHSSGSKEELVQHLKETEEQQKRLKDQIEMCASALGSSDDPAITPTSESGRLPIPEPPSAFRA